MAEPLPVRDDWFVEDLGFPRPKWGAIHGWMRVYSGGEQQNAGWEAFARAWLGRLQKALGGSYVVSESANFVLLNEAGPNSAQSTLNFAEKIRGHILKVLGDLSDSVRFGKHVLLGFTDMDDYETYTAYFLNEGNSAGSGGMFIRDQYHHIAFFYGVSTESGGATMVHEITHNLLADLPLPLWLNEALAMAFETDLTGTARYEEVIETVDRHREYWNSRTIQDFWLGKSFSDVEAQDISYDLAYLLLRLIHSDLRPKPEDFKKFVLRSDWTDAGAIAAREHLGIELSDLAAIFLGPGNWAPRPEEWALDRR